MEKSNNVKIIPSSQIPWISENCIGQGSFGSVHLAKMKLSDEIFAVKSADCHHSRSTPRVESIENEIRILKSLSSSPYIIKYLGDDFTEDSTSTMIRRNLHLEYLPDGTVADSGSHKDERVVRSYTYCILTALNYLHSNGIVHCDVKGKNILIGHVAGTCKLADFGSAIEVAGVNNGAVKASGSPLWMAPEVVRQEHQGTASDIWSIGCTVIEMITGRPAWNDEGVNTTLYKIGYSDELPELPTQLSECGRDFLTKCLNRDRNERWSCDQLLQHPFVSQISPIAVQESSPRCVLDFVIDNEFSDDDDETSTIEGISDDNGEAETSPRMRISELATSSGAANWQSDCWTVVRGEGANSEYYAGAGKIKGSKGVKLEHLERLVLRLFRNACAVVVDGEFVKCRSVAGWSCRHGIYMYETMVVAFTHIRFYYYYYCLYSLNFLFLLLFYLMTIRVQTIFVGYSYVPRVWVFVCFAGYCLPYILA